jgi:hypothetical protein
VLPPIYRFGTGVITDVGGNLTGQVDIVMEFPLTASFPMPAGKQRLYLAESVAAVIEVKSNLSQELNIFFVRLSSGLKLQKNNSIKNLAPYYFVSIKLNTTLNANATTSENPKLKVP